MHLLKVYRLVGCDWVVSKEKVGVLAYPDSIFWFWDAFDPMLPIELFLPFHFRLFFLLCHCLYMLSCRFLNSRFRSCFLGPQHIWWEIPQNFTHWRPSIRVLFKKSPYECPKSMWILARKIFRYSVADVVAECYEVIAEKRWF